MFTREQLIEIKKSTPKQIIPRSLRKTLFKYKLWHPSTPCQYDEHTSNVKSTTGTKYATLNCRSINNKEDSIYELIVDNHLDFLALTETWCYSNSTVSLGHITPAGYSVIHTDRPTRGGGVALVFAIHIKRSISKLGSILHLSTKLFHSNMVQIPFTWPLCMYQVEHFHRTLMTNLVNLLVYYSPCLVNTLLSVISIFD